MSEISPSGPTSKCQHGWVHLEALRSISQAAVPREYTFLGSQIGLCFLFFNQITFHLCPNRIPGISLRVPQTTGMLPFPKAVYSTESSRTTAARFSKFIPSHFSSWKMTSGHGWGSQRLGRPSLDSSPDKGWRPEETASKNVTETSVKNRLLLFRFLLRWAWKLQFAIKTWDLENHCSPSKASPGRWN